MVRKQAASVHLQRWQEEPKPNQTHSDAVKMSSLCLKRFKYDAITSAPILHCQCFDRIDTRQDTASQISCSWNDTLFCTVWIQFCCFYWQTKLVAVALWEYLVFQPHTEQLNSDRNIHPMSCFRSVQSLVLIDKTSQENKSFGETTEMSLLQWCNVNV